MARNAKMQRLAVIVWLAALALLIGLIVYPVRTHAIRLGIAGAVPGLWIGALALVWKRRIPAGILLGAGVIVAAFLCLPGRAPGAAALSAAYVRSLQRYEGTTYVWGGENGRGIDCSGLVREGLVDANLAVGLRALNPRPIRAAFRLWWNDCTAKALRDGHDGLTTPMASDENINNIRAGSLMPGDLAVTQNGLHVLAYLDRGRWIEADPGVGKVIIVSTPSDNPWFAVPVQIVRWSHMK